MQDLTFEQFEQEMMAITGSFLPKDIRFSIGGGKMRMFKGRQLLCSLEYGSIIARSPNPNHLAQTVDMWLHQISVVFKIYADDLEKTSEYFERESHISKIEGNVIHTLGMDSKEYPITWVEFIL